MRWGLSIHAPWEGCDSSLLTSAKSVLKFQFTHPGKGATPVVWLLMLIVLCFNSRTLGRVRQTRSSPDDRRRSSFNSRTLGRVRHTIGEETIHTRHVSIHAPWEGCDCWGCTPSLLCTCFNSRTLGRVRPISSYRIELS